MRLELLGMGEEEKYGWLGRYFDNACQGCDPSVGVSLSSEMPQAFTASTPKGFASRLTIDDLTTKAKKKVLSRIRGVVPSIC